MGNVNRGGTGLIPLPLLAGIKQKAVGPKAGKNQSGRTTVEHTGLGLGGRPGKSESVFAKKGRHLRRPSTRGGRAIG